LSGTLSGYYNSDTSQSPLFTVHVVGHGIAGGTYRFIDNGGGDMFYLDNCCAGITITAAPETWADADIGVVGESGSASDSNTSEDARYSPHGAQAPTFGGTADSIGYVHQPFDGGRNDHWAIESSNNRVRDGLFFVT